MDIKIFKGVIMRRIILLLLSILILASVSYGEADYVYVMVGDGDESYAIDKDGQRINFEALKSSLQTSFYYDNVIYTEMKTITKEVNGVAVEVPSYYFGVKNYKDQIIAAADNDKVIQNDQGYLLLNASRFIQIDTMGHVLSRVELTLPAASRIVDVNDDTYVYELLSGAQGRIDCDGNILETAEAARLTFLEKNIIHYHVNYGLVDESMTGVYGVQIKDILSGHSILSASQGTMGHRVGDNLFAGRNTAGQWYLIDYDGKKVSPRGVNAIGYVNIGQESEGLIAYAIRDKNARYLWGYMDRNEKIIIPAQFSRAGAFKNNFAVVEEGGKKGLINKNGDYVILPELDAITATYNGDDLFYSVKLGEYSGLMDSQFNWIVSPNTYAYANLSQEGIYIVKRGSSGNSMGLLDKQGHTLIPCEFREISKLNADSYVVNKGDQCGIYNIKNQVFLELPYKMARNAGYNYIAVSNDGSKWGIANATGKKVIEMKYDRIGMFRDFNTKKVKS